MIQPHFTIWVPVTSNVTKNMTLLLTGMFLQKTETEDSEICICTHYFITFHATLNNFVGAFKNSVSCRIEEKIVLYSQSLQILTVRIYGQQSNRNNYFKDRCIVGKFRNVTGVSWVTMMKCVLKQTFFLFTLQHQTRFYCRCFSCQRCYIISKQRKCVIALCTNPTLKIDYNFIHMQLHMYT